MSSAAPLDPVTCNTPVHLRFAEGQRPDTPVEIEKPSMLFEVQRSDSASNRGLHAFFDESGTFEPVPRGSLSFSHVVGVIIPAESSDGLRSELAWFESELAPAEKKREEPKGSLLTLDHLKILLEIMKSHADVMVVPVSVNRGYDEPELLNSAPRQICALIEGNLAQDSAYMPRDGRRTLARRIKNMSASDLARILTYMIAVQRTVGAIALHYAGEQFHKHYDPISITFDKVARKESREQLVFKASVLGYVTNWTASVPLEMHPSVSFHHPLGMLYGRESGGRFALDINKMLSNRIHFQGSKEFWQLRLADFLAGAWSRIIDDRSGAKGCLPLFREFHKKTTQFKDQRLGVVGLTLETAKSTPAPLELNVFAEMADDGSEILP